jgi:hypothetical protein
MYTSKSQHTAEAILGYLVSKFRTLLEVLELSKAREIIKSYHTP